MGHIFGELQEGCKIEQSGAEAAPESSRRSGLGSAPQVEGELQALFCREEFGGLMVHDATTENKSEKTRKVGQKS